MSHSNSLDRDMYLMDYSSEHDRASKLVYVGYENLGLANKKFETCETGFLCKTQKTNCCIAHIQLSLYNIVFFEAASQGSYFILQIKLIFLWRQCLLV